MILCKLLVVVICITPARYQADRLTVSTKSPFHTETNERIWKGQNALPGQFPYQTLLVISFGGGGTGMCGGSLISSRTVLTAAHCCYRVENIKVYLGLLEMADGKKDYVQKFIIPSTSFKIHERYNKDTISNDICLIALPTAAQINGNVSVIRLPATLDLNPSQYDHKNAVISGWGQSSKNEGPNPTLQWSTVKMEPHHLCVSNYKFINIVSNSQLCSSRLPRTEPCHGDSGGPMTMKDSSGKSFEIGLVSWGVGSCGTGNAVVYTYVPAYLDWIKNNTIPD